MIRLLPRGDIIGEGQKGWASWRTRGPMNNCLLAATSKELTAATASHNSFAQIK